MQDNETMTIYEDDNADRYLVTWNAKGDMDYACEFLGYRGDDGWEDDSDNSHDALQDAVRQFARGDGPDDWDADILDDLKEQAGGDTTDDVLDYFADHLIRPVSYRLTREQCRKVRVSELDF